MARKNIAFPQVLRSKEGLCAIVYWDHVEYYGGSDGGCHKDYEPQCSDSDKFDPFYEVETCLLGNGFKFVHQASDNYARKDAYIAELEAKLDKMQEQCPEGGCLVEVA